MCTEATKTACEQFGGDRVVFRPLGRIVVKGRAQPVPIFEIMGLREWITPRELACSATFALALERYYARDWDRAAELFRETAALEGPNGAAFTTNPSLVYAGLIEEHKVEPPPEGWDGIYVMKDK
jgi:adenylate cyclase